MKFSHKQNVMYTVAAVLVVFAASLALAYLAPWRDPLSVAVKRIYPAAFVGGRVVSVNDMEQSRQVAGTFGVGETEADEHQLRTERSIILARDLNVRVSNDQLADEALFYTTGNDTEYQSVLDKHYDGSERLFYKFVILPQAIDAHLRIKYYNDRAENSVAYKKAQDVLERLDKGEKFEDLAKAESDDEATAQLGGDLGFAEPGQLLPELEDQVSISATGEVREDVIPSRLGYHLVYPVEYSTANGQKMWHVKHMLFVEDGYDEWLAERIREIGVMRILK